jgi:hypothetical protein
MGIGVKVTGADKAATWASNIVPVTASQVISEMAKIAFSTMQQGAGRHSPRPDGTGKLRSSLYNESQGAFVSRVGHNTSVAPYAQWLLHGSVAHIIRPRNAKMLRFKLGNQTVFARFVKHPGYAGDNYLNVAEQTALSSFARFVDNALRAVP